MSLAISPHGSMANSQGLHYTLLKERNAKKQVEQDRAKQGSNDEG